MTRAPPVQLREIPWPSQLCIGLVVLLRNSSIIHFGAYCNFGTRAHPSTRCGAHRRPWGSQPNFVLDLFFFVPKVPLCFFISRLRRLSPRIAGRARGLGSFANFFATPLCPNTRQLSCTQQTRETRCNAI
jgi:hypothetical protein